MSSTNLRDRVRARKAMVGSGLRLAGQSSTYEDGSVNQSGYIVPNKSSDNITHSVSDDIMNTGMLPRGRLGPFRSRVLGVPVRTGFGQFKNLGDAYEAAAEAGDFVPAFGEVGPYVGELIMGLL